MGCAGRNLLVTPVHEPLTRRSGPYIQAVNTARTVLLYGVGAIAGILLGLAAGQVTTSCTGSCAGTQPRFAVWQSGLIGLGGAVVVLIACALLEEEFIPITRQWLRTAIRRLRVHTAPERR
jgi:hypothetical protein